MRHHYVPQFLLRPWAEGSFDGKLEVFRLDLDRLSSSRRAPKYTAFEDDLYALSKPEVAGMEKQAIEKIFLRQVDNLAARAHQKLARKGLSSLTNEEWSDWVRFLMSLLARQPGIVQQLKTDSAEHLRKVLAERPEEYQEIAQSGDAPTLIEWTEKRFPGLIENFGLSFFQEIANNSGIGEKIFRMKRWLWDFTDVSFDLLLGDHPCIFTAGIDDPNLVIAVPISPKKAFMATNSTELAASMRGQDPKLLAMRMNESSLSQARTRIYARNISPRRFIQNRVPSRKAR